MDNNHLYELLSHSGSEEYEQWREEYLRIMNQRNQTLAHNKKPKEARAPVSSEAFKPEISCARN